jgi:sugar/nucleoside kinase (ribokinase family)
MQSKLPFDVLVPGDYFCDLIFTGLPGFPALGAEMYTDNLAVVPGGVLNTVVALRRLGVNVGWIGAVGNDVFSHYVMHTIEAEGLDTSLLMHTGEALQRVTVALSYPEDRAFITHIDPSPGLTELTLKALEQVTCKHLHLPGLCVDPRMSVIVDTCHAQGMTVSMDCQHQEQTIHMPAVRQILSRVDIFMPNATETRRLTGQDDLQEAVKALTDLGVNYLVVKNGCYGTIARRDGLSYYEPALKFDSIVDTTGAGDVFNAGFLAGYLQGRDTPTCLRWANYCGGMSTQGPGGLSTAPRLAQLEAWLSEQG